MKRPKLCNVKVLEIQAQFNPTATIADLTIVCKDIYMSTIREPALIEHATNKHNKTLKEVKQKTWVFMAKL